MPKDLKIGMILGLVVVIAAAVWLATRPSLSTKARIGQIDTAEGLYGTVTSPNTVPGGSEHADDHQSETVDLTVYERPEKIKTQRFHIVHPGETLSSIARQYYGSPGKWQKIYQANQETVKNPNKLIPGTKLIIPD